MNTPQAPAESPTAVSDEALQRAEKFVEEEEGAANKLHGWLGGFVRLLAFVMSAFHLYTAYAIVPTQTLRPIHVAFVLALCFLVFPVAKRFRHRDHVVGLAGRRARRRDRRLCAAGRRRLHRPQHLAEPLGHRVRHRPDRAGARGDAALDRLGHADRHGVLPALCAARPVPAGAVDAQGLRGRPPGRRDVHDARGHLRRRGRRRVVADHPVHDLRRVPAAVGRRQVLHRLLVLGDGRQADRRGSHRGAGVVPARRAIGLRRRDDGHARRGRVPDAREGRLREERGRRPARRGRARRDHLAAGARCGRVPDRRVPEDLVPRRAADGGHSDLAVLPRAVPDGRDRCAQVRHGQRRVREGRQRLEPEQALLVPLPVAGLDRLLHDVGLLAGALGVLGHGRRLRDQLPAPRDRAVLVRPVPRQGLGQGAPARLEVREGDGGRLARHAQRRRDLRRRRHHRRRRHA